MSLVITVSRPKLRVEETTLSLISCMEVFGNVQHPRAGGMWNVRGIENEKGGKATTWIEQEESKIE